MKIIKLEEASQTIAKLEKLPNGKYKYGRITFSEEIFNKMGEVLLNSITEEKLHRIYRLIMEDDPKANKDDKE